MSDAGPVLQLALGALGGVLLGIPFYGLLWWTVRSLPDARHPGLLLLASYVVRMAVAVVGVWLLSGGRWERAAGCLLGLLAVKLGGCAACACAPARGEAGPG